MKTITHEGETYVLKSEMDSAIQSRIQKLSARAAEAESQVQSLQSELDSVSGRLGALDNLQGQIETLKGQLETANGRFDRYQAVSKYGLTDPDHLELVEWQYSRSMSTLSKKDQLPLGEWLESLVQDPSKAPLAIRPHLQSLQTSAPSQETAPPSQEAAPQMQTIRPESSLQAPAPPKMNSGALQAPPVTDNLVDRGLKDLEFYRQNRDAIKNAFFQNRRS
jgi:hypothetical protein